MAVIFWKYVAGMSMFVCCIVALLSVRTLWQMIHSYAKYNVHYESEVIQEEMEKTKPC